MLFCQHSDEDLPIGTNKTYAAQDYFIHRWNKFPLLYFFPLLSTNCWNKFQITNLVWLIGTQSAAEVRVAPSKRFIPRGWDENLVLFYCQNAFISTYNLPHRLLELWKRRWGYVLLLGETNTIWSLEVPAALPKQGLCSSYLYILCFSSTDGNFCSIPNKCRAKYRLVLSNFLT